MLCRSFCLTYQNESQYVPLGYRDKKLYSFWEGGRLLTISQFLWTLYRSVMLTFIFKNLERFICMPANLLHILIINICTPIYIHISLEGEHNGPSGYLNIYLNLGTTLLNPTEPHLHICMYFYYKSLQGLLNGWTDFHDI